MREAGITGCGPQQGQAPGAAATSLPGCCGAAGMAPGTTATAQPLGTTATAQPLGTNAPLEVRLAAGPARTDGAPGSGGAAVLRIAPLTLEVFPDVRGPVGTNAVRVENTSSVPQVFWLSGTLPPEVSLRVEAERPHVALLHVRIDLAKAATVRAGTVGAMEARLFVTTAAGVTPVRVIWRPIPYGGK